MRDVVLFDDARATLAKNDTGKWTLPTSISLYPHQWLWDTFFHAIGQRHYDIERAKDEVRSPFRAQWDNGMVPHIIFSDSKGYHAGPEIWRTIQTGKGAPKHIETTGVSQPPVAAEATVRIGEMLKPRDRRKWYAEMYPKILKWHQWFYRERDPRGDCLVTLFLSWESGMDNSPPLMEMLHKYAMSRRVKVMKATGLHTLVEKRRKDTREVPASQRISTVDVHAIYDLIRNMRRRHYDYRQIQPNHKFQVIDLAMNCILIRANQHLASMAEELGKELPADIKRAIRVAPHSLEALWDDEAGFYYNRDVRSGQLIPLPSSATFLPLYALQLPPERIKRLLGHLHDPKTFATTFPIPSAPLNSPYFNPHCYWQGPSWVNINWLVAEGLERNGQKREAESLRQKTLKMVEKGGMYEYFSPKDASPAGAPAFSWTAALAIDLLRRKQK